MIYCSGVCREQARYAAARAKRADLRGTRICDNCDETFEPRRSDAKFCSDACKQRAYRKRVTLNKHYRTETLNICNG
jgi:hypothetical protein